MCKWIRTETIAPRLPHRHHEIIYSSRGQQMGKTDTNELAEKRFRNLITTGVFQSSEM